MASKMTVIRDLQNRTELPLDVCKSALDAAEYDIDQALGRLRSDGRLGDFRTKEELLAELPPMARQWADGFLEQTRHSGELDLYEKAGERNVIEDNYYYWNVAGHEWSHHSVFRRDLQALPHDEQDEIEQRAETLYGQLVAELLPSYLTKAD